MAVWLRQSFTNVSAVGGSILYSFHGLIPSATLPNLLTRSFKTSTPLEKFYLKHHYLKKWGRRDMKRRALYEQHEMERSNLRYVKKNDILPSAVRKKAAEDLENLPRDSSITRVRNRCVLTDRGRGLVGRYRISRIMFRHYADKGLIAGMQKSTW
ncbi:28S ribosomal protein S14, mitochondrial-like [Orbicella faveolata]|uniref:28S ribosomal protein S14, mitochondrial-like n=1 Tax=Orbicella faveolata TaxID=48498 RepID=UPI0009E5F02E|nr:28S ribosomal protein S14, mitochondrial-like [Orbicella faveolata]